MAVGTSVAIQAPSAANSVQKIVEIIREFGYEAITEKEVPGFVENRILYAILRECLSLVERGIISEADLDTCVKWGIDYKLAVIGPMRLLDMAGLDIYASVASYLNPDLSASTGVPEMITERARAGQLGMKTPARHLSLYAGAGGSVAGVPFAADTASLVGTGPADFGSRAEACADQAAACTPLPDGEASTDYLSHLVRVHARRALGEAFAAAAS